MHVTFSLKRNTCRTHKKLNDSLTYINTLSNHPPQIIKHLNQTTSKRFSRSSSSPELLKQSKPYYEEVLTKCDYKAKMQYAQPNFQQNNTKKRSRKIIWFKPPFSLNVKANVAVFFVLQLTDTHFPPTNKFHKTLNRNTVKVSYSCTQNISHIIKGNNKKVTQIKRHRQLSR